MNPQKIALAVLLAAGAIPASAQSAEIYGVLDAGVSHVSGMSGGSKTSVVSGIMDGSRLGFKGSEDLGAGYRALFTIEHRLEVDSGGISNRAPSGTQLPDRMSTTALLGLPSVLQPAVNGVATVIGSQIGVNVAGNMWDRQAYLGLVTPYGAVLGGRQYTPAYEASVLFDTLGAQSALSAGQVGTFPAMIDIRLSNTLAYRLKSGNFSGALMLAPGENSTTTGRFFGANVLYQSPLFSVGAGYNKRKNELGLSSLTTFLLGGSVKLGPGSLVSSLAYVRDENPSALSSLGSQIVTLVGPTNASLIQNAFVRALRQDARLLHLGYRRTIGPHTFYTAGTYFDDHTPSNADLMSYGAAYTYAFSKRTDANLVLVRFNNKNLAQAAPGQAGSLGGVTRSAGTDSNSITLGVRHRF